MILTSLTYTNVNPDGTVPGVKGKTIVNGNTHLSIQALSLIRVEPRTDTGVVRVNCYTFENVQELTKFLIQHLKFDYANSNNSNAQHV